MIESEWCMKENKTERKKKFSGLIFIILVNLVKINRMPFSLVWHPKTKKSTDATIPMGPIIPGISSTPGNSAKKN